MRGGGCVARLSGLRDAADGGDMAIQSTEAATATGSLTILGSKIFLSFLRPNPLLNEINMWPWLGEMSAAAGACPP